VCTSGEWGSLAALTDINYHISQKKKIFERDHSFVKENKESSKISYF
jgi:hypothetical protein